MRTQQYRLDDAGQLFDLTADPGQRRDLTREQPDVAKMLARAVADWRSTVLGELARDESDQRPFPVGYSDRATILPARDGVPHGKITRSARAPNCSFFKNWKSTDDSITWDIEVDTPGGYDAIVLYTCPNENLGATVELEFAGQRAAAKVNEAFDPPLRGAEHDRFPRGSESLVKDFAPLALGTIELKHGRGQLTLRAADVPGKGVIDVRGVVLTRIELP